MEINKKYVFVVTRDDKKVVVTSVTDLVNYTTEGSVLIESMELATVIDRGRVITGRGFIIERVEVI